MSGVKKDMTGYKLAVAMRDAVYIALVPSRSTNVPVVDKSIMDRIGRLMKYETVASIQMKE